MGMRLMPWEEEGMRTITVTKESYKTRMYPIVCCLLYHKSWSLRSTSTTRVAGVFSAWMRSYRWSHFQVWCTEGGVSPETFRVLSSGNGIF